eukprot:3518912-Pleurochrysis_carterae.AAC.1
MSPSYLAVVRLQLASFRASFLSDTNFMQKLARGTCFWLVDKQLREQQPQHTLEAHAGAMHLLLCT